MQDSLSSGKEKEINTASHILIKYHKPQTMLTVKKILCWLFHIENTVCLQKLNISIQ